jgi:hypothetical protein
VRVMADHETHVVVEQKKFQDYHLGHRRRLRELRVNSEGALNEIVVHCLPYPGKSSSIREIIAWFDKKIQTLPDAIVKGNKDFLVYCLLGVLKMLQGHAECRHVDGLDAIKSSCDGSILDEKPNDIVKLAARIVKRWWSLHGLLYVTEVFCVEPDVRVSCALLRWS